MDTNFDLDALPYAYSCTQAHGHLREVPEDFMVTEELGFTATGEGEHVLIQLRKKLENTEQVARRLARLAGVPRKAVSYAGLKDRHAVTSQYFTVHLPGRSDPDWGSLNSDDLEVMSVQRHQKKLKRGALSKNIFQIKIRQFDGDRDGIGQRLEEIKFQGVPNYFMEQRFGHDYHNLHTAGKVLTQGLRIKDRFKRNIYLSAARSWLFNLVLAKRIEANLWNRAVEGDSLMLDQGRACFHVEAVDPVIESRIQNLEVHPTAPLWGKGVDMVTDQALELQREVLGSWEPWLTGLVNSGQEMARRSLRISVRDLEWDWSDDVLQLEFSLSTGSYATAVLREILVYDDMSRSRIFSDAS